MDDRETSWTELRKRIACIAAGLQRQGLKPGDRVAILANNSERYFENLFAIPWAGGVITPINCRLADPEIAYWLEDSGAKIILVDNNFADRVKLLQPQLKDLQTLIYMEQEHAPSGYIEYAQLLEYGVVDDAGRSNDDLAAIYYTGGTTGRSKGVMLSHQNLVANSLQSSSFLNLKANKRILHAAPIFHIACTSQCLASTLVAASNHFIASFDPEKFMQTVESAKIEQSMLVPTMINMLVHNPAFKKYDLSSLVDILYGASPMPEAVISKALEMLPTPGFSKLTAKQKQLHSLPV